MASTPLAPIPGSPTSPTSYGPRPAEGQFELPIPEQIRALLQSRLTVTLTDGRILRGTLTSVDSTSVLMSNVEELREVESENVRRFWPWSKDGINAGFDEDAAPVPKPVAAGVGRDDAGEGRDGADGDGEGEGAQEAAEGDDEGRVGGGGPRSTIRRRELQSILVQFAHCTSIELDEENHTAWRRYCEMPAELRPAPTRQQPQFLGQAIM